MNNRIVEDAIEVHGPDYVQMIAMPGECNITRVGVMVLQLMEAAGYESIKPDHGAAFAFAPKVYEDEVAETPFEPLADSPLERLCLIPGTRVTAIGGDTDGYYFAHIHDYTSGIEYEATFRERGYRLRPAGGE